MSLPSWDYEGKVEFVFSGYEGYTTAYIEGEDQDDLAEVLAAQFAKKFYDEDYWRAAGQLKISVELVTPFAVPPPPISRREPPTCNCVHVNAPDDHLPYCATWGGKRLPGSEKL